MTLPERVNEIRLVLQRPIHLFTFLGEEQGIMLILESMDHKNNPRYSFRGDSVIGAVKKAEEYIERERTMGSMQPKKTPKPDEGKKPSEPINDNPPPNTSN